MIRRPLMYVTLSLVAVTLSCYYFGIFPALLPAVGFGTALLFSKKGSGNKRRNLLLLLTISCLLGVMRYLASQHDAGRLEQLEGEEVLLECIVRQVTEKTTYSGWSEEMMQERVHLQIKADVLTLNEKPMERQERILLNHYGNDSAVGMGGQDSDEPEQAAGKMTVLPGDVIFVKGVIERPDGQRNPGCFDYALYLRSIGIRCQMTASKLEFVEQRGSRTVQGRLHMGKEKFLSALSASAGTETAGLMRAVLFGEKTELEEDTLEEFQKNGTAHVLAVSGLHVGILYGLLTVLWRWRKGVLFFCTIMAFFCCYMTAASFSPSVVRAVLMICLHAFAKLTHRRYDLSSAAFLTALLMLLKNPMHLFHAGFQMSFLAVLTLSLITPIIKKVYTGLFLSSVSIQLGLVPYTVYMFNYLSLGAVFVNVPVIFLTGLIVPAGLMSMAAMGISDAAFDLIAGVIFGLCRMMTWLNGMTGIDGVTVFSVASPPVGAVAFYYLFLLLFVSEEGRILIIRHRKKAVFLLMAAAVGLSVIFSSVAGNPFKAADVVFVDVGQGDCIHFRTENGGNYLIDGGGSINYEVGKKTLKPYLLKNGVKKVNGAFVTHLHTDHYKGIAELCREGMVETLFLYEGNKAREKEVLEETGLAREAIVYLYKGQTVDLGADAEIQVLWPGRETAVRYQEMAEQEEDENLSSMILKVVMKGRSVLATADVDQACLDDLTAFWGDALDSDILKVPHHGSKYSYSESFVEAAAPAYAVFQVGKNNFGHPDKGVIENYLGNDIMICRNDEDGAAAFYFAGNSGLRMKTIKGEEP